MADKAEFALQWLIDTSRPVTAELAGAIISIISREAFISQGCAHRGVDLADRARVSGRLRHFQEDRYLRVAVSACEHILRDLEHSSGRRRRLHQLYSGKNSQVHNANTLGGSLLARTYSHTRNESYRALAQKAMQYTAQHQRPDSSWYYGRKGRTALG